MERVGHPTPSRRFLESRSPPLHYRPKQGGITDMIDLTDYRLVRLVTERNYTADGSWSLAANFMHKDTPPEAAHIIANNGIGGGPEFEKWFVRQAVNLPHPCSPTEFAAAIGDLALFFFDPDERLVRGAKQLRGYEIVNPAKDDD